MLADYGEERPAGAPSLPDAGFGCHGHSAAQRLAHIVSRSADSSCHTKIAGELYLALSVSSFEGRKILQVFFEIAQGALHQSAIVMFDRFFVLMFVWQR